MSRRPRPSSVAVRAIVLSAALAGHDAVAQTPFTFTGTKSALWDDPTSLITFTIQPNWSPSSIPPAPPNSPDADITIPLLRTVDVNGVFTVGRLHIEPTAVVDVGGGLAVQPGSFTGSGAVTNDGAINLPAGIAFGNGHTLADVTVTGSGSITLNGGILGPNNVGYNGRLVNNSNTISGFGNIGQTFAGAGRISFTNHALVNANVPFTGSNALTWAITDIDGPTAFGANSGTLRASSGALFNIFGGTLDNTGGTLQALNASTVRLGTMTLNSGTLTTTGTGVIEATGQPTLDTVTNSGLYRVLSGASTILSGVTQNTGTLAVSSIPGGTSTLIGNNATLAGAGVVQFEGQGNDNRLNGAVVNQNNTIRGAGLINGTFTNQSQGVVDANVPYDPSVTTALTIWSGFTNAGTIQASNGGRLIFQFTQVVDNTNGIIRALNGSSIVINGNQADIRGGTLATTGTGAITGSNVTLRNLTNAGNYTVGSSSGLYLDGAIQNTGSINLPGNTSIILSNTVTLSGAGTVNLTAASVSTNNSAAGYTLTNQSNTLRGTGQFGNGFDIFNHALVSADVPYVQASDNRLIYFPSNASTNTGTIQAVNGALLNVRFGVLDNAGGTIRADGGNSVVLFTHNARVNNGTLATTNSGQIQIEIATLGNVTLNGNATKLPGFGGFLAGTFTNNGAVTIDNSSLSVIEGDVTLAGPGTIILLGGSSALGGDGNNRTLINQSNTIQGAGRIGAFSAVNILNHALINGNDPTTPMDVRPQTTFTNGPTGTLRASGAAGVTFSTGTLVNSGTLESINGSTLAINRPTTMAGGSFAGTSLITAQSVDVTGTSSKNGSGTLRISEPLTITSPASFNVNAGHVILNLFAYLPVALNAYAAAGYNNGAWNGQGGLASATAAADPLHVKALAVADNNVLKFTTFGGQPVPAFSALMQVTYYGDTNLDGRVNADDYVRTDRGFQKHLTGWVNGDFNYDNTINNLDYQLIDRAFALQGNPLSPDFLMTRQAQFGPDYVSQLLASIPEPTFPACLFASLLLPRKRRRVPR